MVSYSDPRGYAWRRDFDSCYAQHLFRLENMQWTCRSELRQSDSLSTRPVLIML